MHSLQHPADTEYQTVVIPFGMEYTPVKKLAIINFEKSPVSDYIGFELQYLDDKQIGTGYRVIVYRTDGYVDVYDEQGIQWTGNENFDVVGKGLADRIALHIKKTSFEKINRGISLSFEFYDKQGKEIVAHILEQSPKQSKGIHMLAPVGHSTKNPTYLPLFFLYDFDFVRKHQTTVDLTIAGEKVKQDSFPVPFPKDFQRRYYSRYTPNCVIVEFAKATTGNLEECMPSPSGIVNRDLLEYQYETGILQKITLKHPSHPICIQFGAGFPDIRRLTDGESFSDTFQIVADDKIGDVSGKYSINRTDHTVTIELIPTNGWTAMPRTLLTKIMFGEKSIFRKWPKTYRYVQTIDVRTLSSVSYWERIRQ